MLWNMFLLRLPNYDCVGGLGYLLDFKKNVILTMQMHVHTMERSFLNKLGILTCGIKIGC